MLAFLNPIRPDTIGCNASVYVLLKFASKSYSAGNPRSAFHLLTADDVSPIGNPAKSNFSCLLFGLSAKRRILHFIGIGFIAIE